MPTELKPNQIIHNDCMNVLAEMEDNVIDTIITDPPYHLGSISKRFTKTSLGDDNDTAANARNGSNQYARLSTGFMGKSWDGGGIAFQPELWAEMLRVAKPGATLLAFGGSRTHHRLMVAIEDAGWEIRDCLMWLYGSGFPKSLSIGKSLDKRYKKKPEYLELAEFIKTGRKNTGLSQKDVASYFPSKTGGLTGCVWNWEHAMNVPTQEQWIILCRVLKLPGKYDWLIKRETKRWEEAKREVIGKAQWSNSANHFVPGEDHTERIQRNVTAAATEAAKTFDGFGTGLKPAYEPIILAMKPIEKNYANNAQVWGVAGLNIDGGRIGTDGRPLIIAHNEKSVSVYGDGLGGSHAAGITAQGRWPANVLLSHSEGCVRRGERKVKIQTGGKGTTRKKYSLFKSKESGTERGAYIDPNGLETVADWSCVDGCPIRILDEQAGVRKSGKILPHHNGHGWTSTNSNIGWKRESHNEYTQTDRGFGDSGSASRFFYTSKAPNREKWFYCQLCAQAYPNKKRDNHGHDIPKDQRKHIIAHPTVKPLEILKYLCTLTKTPTGGIVLDPFAGSGTTALACLETGRDFILIEKEADYYEIAKARVEAAMSEPRQAELWTIE